MGSASRYAANWRTSTRGRYGGDGDDLITGGLGIDTITSQDGFVDTINCGLGKDKLTRDGNDSVKRCE